MLSERKVVIGSAALVAVALDAHPEVRPIRGLIIVKSGRWTASSAPGGGRNAQCAAAAWTEVTSQSAR
jgi:hypothetical protein